MLNSSLCDYSDARIFFKGTMKVPKKAGACQLENSDVNNAATEKFK